MPEKRSTKKSSQGLRNEVREENSKKLSKHGKANSITKLIEEEIGDSIKNKSKLHQLTFKLTTEYRDAVTDLARLRGEPVSEVTRRALFAILSNPKLLDEVEETEQAYRQSLGPSRHHK